MKHVFIEKINVFVHAGEKDHIKYIVLPGVCGWTERFKTRLFHQPCFVSICSKPHTFTHISHAIKVPDSTEYLRGDTWSKGGKNLSPVLRKKTNQDELSTAKEIPPFVGMLINNK